MIQTFIEYATVMLADTRDAHAQHLTDFLPVQFLDEIALEHIDFAFERLRSGRYLSGRASRLWHCPKIVAQLKKVIEWHGEIHLFVRHVMVATLKGQPQPLVIEATRTAISPTRGAGFAHMFEPRRVCQRLFGLGHAAITGCATAAIPIRCDLAAGKRHWPAPLTETCRGRTPMKRAVY